jgi:geranylgeranyl diphosphate synthase type II
MTGKFEVEEYMKSLKSVIDDALIEMLKPIREDVPQKLYEAIAYSLTAGGKRLRPILLISSFSIVNDTWENALPYAVAIEYIHTYSLIHDDLPSMDDDDYRRGVPTCHKVFGEAMAILAGDALLTEAFRIFLEEREDGISSEKKIRASRKLAEAAGASGMVGGQALDIEFTSRKADEEGVKMIHQKKTAALIRASILCGGILSGATEDQLATFSAFGFKLGLAFQIVDDILDVKSSFSEMGKKTGKDAAIGKATYPSVVGLQRAEADAIGLVREANDCIMELGEKAISLKEIASLCLSRRN